MSEKFIPYSCQSISEEDINAVVKVLRSEYLTQGPEIELFEAALCEKTGATHAVVVSSATAALHCAMTALEIGPKSLVWTSPVTFVASANCARYLGAEVDFVDIDPQTGNICIEELSRKLQHASKIDRLPQVVIPVHLAGKAVDMAGILELSKKYSFEVVEDCAHALGGRYSDNKKIGGNSKSISSVVSFHAIKAITTGEGGAILTSNEKIASRLKDIRTHGITRDPSRLIKKQMPCNYYEQQILGYNYRLPDILAALGRSQLTKLDDFISQRISQAKRYHKALQDSEYQLPELDLNSAWHLFWLRVPGGEEARDLLAEKLRRNKIGSNIHYRPVHLQPYYDIPEGTFPKAEEFAKSVLSIPLHPKLTLEQQDRVIDVILR